MPSSDKLKVKQQKRSWYLRNRDKILKCARGRYEERAAVIYGIPLEELVKLREIQDSRCAICNRVAVKLEVDHSHETGRVRQLICHTCNAMLGMGKDNPEILRRGAEYIALHSLRFILPKFAL